MVQLLRHYLIILAMILSTACGPSEVRQNPIPKPASESDDPSTNKKTSDNSSAKTSDDDKNHTTDKNEDEASNDAADNTPIDLVGAHEFIKVDKLRGMVEDLAGEEFEGRKPCTKGYDSAGDYVIKKLKSYNIQPGYESGYKQNFKLFFVCDTFNVVAKVEGNDPNLKSESIVIGAHLDHLGVKGQSIYYGADDNASGTAAVLNLAEAIASISDQIKRSVVFLLFSGEETGLNGSRHYASTISAKDTKFMINIDMIGYAHSGELQVLMGKGVNLNDLQMGQQDLYGLKVVDAKGGSSDHDSFAKKGIPATFFHTGTHDNYHEPTDTPEKLDYERMENIVKLILDLALAKAN